MADNSFGLMSPNLFVAVFIIDVEAGDVIIFLIIKKKNHHVFTEPIAASSGISYIIEFYLHMT